MAGGQEAYCIAGRDLEGNIAFLAHTEAVPCNEESLEHMYSMAAQHGKTLAGMLAFIRPCHGVPKHALLLTKLQVL